MNRIFGVFHCYLPTRLRLNQRGRGHHLLFGFIVAVGVGVMALLELILTGKAIAAWRLARRPHLQGRLGQGANPIREGHGGPIVLKGE